VKAFVKAAGIQTREALLRLGHPGDRHLLIGLLLHHLMVQDEWVRVFNDAYLDAQFHGDTGFSLANPFGVGFKDREDFLVVGNDFAENGYRFDARQGDLP
jgi:hypothetical protein